MTSESRDRELGMHRRITRRDFLDGAVMAIGGAALAAHSPALPRTDDAINPPQQQGDRPAYPPALGGLRGDQDRIFEFAHQLRDGKSWE